MIKVSVPTIIKIREGITINLSLSVSQAVEKQLPQKRLKADAKEAINNGTLKHTDVQDSHYEVYNKADTLSFWFTGNQSLAYRVGEEISQEDFDRVSIQLNAIQYRTPDERVPSSNDTSK